MSKVGACDQTLLLPPLLQSFLDSPPRIHDVKEGCLIKGNSVKVIFASYADAIQLFRTEHQMKQLELHLWVKERYWPCELRFSHLLLTPHSRFWLNPSNPSVAVDSWATGAKIANSNLADIPPLESGFNILAWNCRGMGRACFISNLECLLRYYTPDAVILTETRIGMMNATLVVEDQLFHEWSSTFVEPKGLTNGFIVLCKPHIRFDILSATHTGLQGVFQGDGSV